VRARDITKDRRRAGRRRDRDRDAARAARHRAARDRAESHVPKRRRTDHDLTVEALGLRLVARPGETVTAGLRDLGPGRYDGYCSMLGHAMAGMRMTVMVR
jgi:uncharacterized cupredoxin-like copper-binding protein